MKREKKGSLSAALTILALAVISTVAEAQYLSFPFNTAYYEPKNFFSASLSLLLPFALWCVVSYCLTTLMNGEGAFRDIVMATCYALTPMVLTYIPLTLISYALTLEESGLVTLVHTVVLIWTAFLLIAGTLEIHQYTMFKTVMTILFTTRHRHRDFPGIAAVHSDGPNVDLCQQSGRGNIPAASLTRGETPGGLYTNSQSYRPFHRKFV